MRSLLEAPARQSRPRRSVNILLWLLPIGVLLGLIACGYLMLGIEGAIVVAVAILGIFVAVVCLVSFVRMISESSKKAALAFLITSLLLGLILSAVFPYIRPQAERAKVNATRASIHMIQQAMGEFKDQNRRYPTTEEGLDALVHPPANVKGPFLEKLPTDAWTHSFVYEAPAENGEAYRVHSMGPDGRDGTPDDVYEEK